MQYQLIFFSNTLFLSTFLLLLTIKYTNDEIILYLFLLDPFLFASLDKLVKQMFITAIGLKIIRSLRNTESLYS